MNTVTILHNPRCSKSRQALALLEEKGVPLTVVQYLNDPLNIEELKAIYRKLDIENVTGMMRVKDADYKALHLNASQTTDEQRFAAMASTPKLLERPIVINGDTARIGRPPEAILDIL